MRSQVRFLLAPPLLELPPSNESPLLVGVVNRTAGQKVVETIGGLSIKPVIEVAASVERHHDGAASHPLLQRLRVGALADGHGHRGVTKVVKAALRK